MDFFTEIEINGSEAETIARGLFAVARIDGIHERELALIASFYGDAGGGGRSLAELEGRAPIKPAELAAGRPGADHRRLFVKTALLLAWVDSVVTPAERTLIEQFATALGLSGEELARLEDGVKDFLLGQISHLKNTDATRKVAGDLKL
jgi:tellurite resistance protein